MSRFRVATAAAIVLLAAMGAAVFAQDKLGVSARIPSVDGTVTANEYSYSHDFDQQMTLYASRTATTLYLAVVANTRGWVGVGVGPKMDGADIFMGFVKDGKVSFKPQLGKGHGHKDAPADVSDTVQKSAMKQSGGKTTLEIALKADAYIKKGQSTLDLIFAMGDQASYTPYHSYRNMTTLALQ